MKESWTNSGMEPRYGGGKGCVVDWESISAYVFFLIMMIVGPIWFFFMIRLLNRRFEKDDELNSRYRYDLYHGDQISPNDSVEYKVMFNIRFDPDNEGKVEDVCGDSIH